MKVSSLILLPYLEQIKVQKTDCDANSDHKSEKKTWMGVWKWMQFLFLKTEIAIIEKPLVP